MGGIYSRISRLRLEEKCENLGDAKSVNNPMTQEPKTPCSFIPKYLLDPRSATAEIKRTPIVVMREAMSKGEETDTTPIGPLPYLETDLDCSDCTIRTSTPVTSASPMRELFQPSPVLSRSEPFDCCDNELADTQLDEVFYLDSDEEDVNEQLFNNERVLFESEDQGSFEEDDFKINANRCNIVAGDFIKPDVYLISEDSCEIDNEVEEITCPTAENSLEREFTEIEDCVFSPVNPSVPSSTVTKTLATGVLPFKLDNHLAKTKSGRTPLGVVSSNPCSPMQNVNLIINKDADDGKTWRGFNEERVNRGLLDVENTPPPASLPPPDILHSAPGKLLLQHRGHTGKAAWGRDNSLII